MSQRDDTYLNQLQARCRRVSMTVILGGCVETTCYQQEPAVSVLKG